jgi:hypothetical protein
MPLARCALGIVTALTAGGCGGSALPPAKSVPGGLAELSWLAGAFRASTPDGEVEELWAPPKGRSMLGIARTVRGEQTLFFEFLRIEERDDGRLYYVAQPLGRPAVHFGLTGLSAERVVFENRAHDHPVRITYQRKGSRLVTRVEGVRGQADVIELEAAPCVPPLPAAPPPAP